MGYYTEFRCKVTLVRDTPEEIIETLDRAINDFDCFFAELMNVREDPTTTFSNSDGPRLPINHPFGKCSKWYMLFHSNNFEPQKFFGSRFNRRKKTLDIYTEFKSCDNEVLNFCKWITPYINLDKEVEIWSQGEDSDQKNHYESHVH